MEKNFSLEKSNSMLSKYPNDNLWLWNIGLPCVPPPQDTADEKWKRKWKCYVGIITD